VIPNFDWNLAKALENRLKHGVSFEEAASVFGDDDALIDNDVAHAASEDRLIIIGMSDRDRTLLTIFTIREDDVVRIISSRRAIPRERRAYEQKKRSSR
jgi:uncharacterized DUF497 family protein